MARTGTPLVVQAPGDAIDVTFLLRAAPDSGPWTLTDGISPGANPEFALTNAQGAASGTSPYGFPGTPA